MTEKIIEKFGLTFPLPLQVIESDFPISPQGTRYSCGHSVMKAEIKLVKGIDVPEETLVKMAFRAERNMKIAKSTPKERWANEDGWKYHQLHFKGMRVIAQHYKMAGVVILNASDELATEMLKDDLKPVIEWHSPRCAFGHYSIIAGRQNGTYSMADPGDIDQLNYRIKRDIVDILWRSHDGKQKKLFAFWDKEDQAQHEKFREKYRDGRHF